MQFLAISCKSVNSRQFAWSAAQSRKSPGQPQAPGLKPLPLIAANCGFFWRDLTAIERIELPAKSICEVHVGHPVTRQRAGAVVHSGINVLPLATDDRRVKVDEAAVTDPAAADAVRGVTGAAG